MGTWPIILLLNGMHIANKSEEIIEVGKSFTLECNRTGLTWNHPVDDADRVSENNTDSSTIIKINNPNLSDRGLYECYDPKDTKINASVFLYIFDKEILLVRRQKIKSLGQNKYLMPCLPTHPDVKVTLKNFPNDDYDPRRGFIVERDGRFEQLVTCEAEYQNKNDSAKLGLPTKPIVKYVHDGQNITLKCAKITQPRGVHTMKWKLPNNKQPNKTEGIFTIIDNDKGNGSYTMYKNLVITSAKKDDEGEYSCEMYSYRLQVLEEGTIHLKVDLLKEIIGKLDNEYANIIATYEASPKPIFTWLDPNGNKIELNRKYKLSITENHIELKIYHLTTSDAGIYKLSVEINKKRRMYDVKLQLESSPIVKMEPNLHPFQVNHVYNLSCNVYAFPKANVTWIFQSCFSPELCDEKKTEKVIYAEKENASLYLQWEAITPGKITCEASNSLGNSSDYIIFSIADFHQSENSSTIGAVAAILVLLVVVMICLVIKIVHDKKQMNKITARDIAAFHEGSLNKMNPDLEIDEQAHLLPYNNCYEFPKEKLKLGKQLGNGAFGVVVKAEAEGIKENEVSTTVAVKMVKSHANITHLKALMTELKILMYIGQHLNVLNLLGACTVNLMQKELLVIVEYCRYGNLHSYMHRHRESFVNQIHPITKLIDFRIGRDQVEKGENVSMNPAGDPLICFSNDSIYARSSGIQLPSSFTGETTISNREDSVYSSRSSQVLNQWSIIYRNDSGNDIAAPINTKELLSWSFQVAMGMDYLSSRKIVHADLASRNILLADNNIIKICDFGLARPLYGKLNYQKKGKDPLPIRWMAIESLESKIFSSKSDVWSFGIVLWEIFSLGKSPYPGIEVNDEFLGKLLDGYRMAKPEFSPDEITMQECWEIKPNDRPTFSELSERIGQILDKDTKEYYLNLSKPEVGNEATSVCYENWMKQKDIELVPPEFPESTYVNSDAVEAELRNIHQMNYYQNMTPSTTSEYMIMSRASDL